MNNKIILGGVYGTPVFTEIENYKEFYLSHEYGTKSNFRDKYIQKYHEMSILAECAKVFVYENYKKVNDWTDLDIVLFDNNPNLDDSPKQRRVHFYNMKKPEDRNVKGVMNKIYEDLYKDRNVVKSVTDVILDETDGDFSITVNGRSFWWINNDAVIVLADYIEEKLKEIE